MPIALSLTVYLPALRPARRLHGRVVGAAGRRRVTIGRRGRPPRGIIGADAVKPDDMSLKPDDLDDVPAALRKQVLGRLDKAAAALGRGAAGVHDARKQFKKARAMLRLLRDAIGERRFKHANRAVRDAGRPLSAARDVAALRETIKRLRRDAPKAARSLASVQRARPQDGDGARAIARVRRTIAETRADVDGWSVAAGGWRTLRGPLGGSYRAARRAFRAAYDRDHDDVAWHEARKRVKDLRYQLELLAPLAGEAIGPLAALARKLSDVIGDDHDLAILRGVARGAAHAEARSLIDERRDALKAEARRLGDELYAERPREFRRRLHAYWRAFAAA